MKGLQLLAAQKEDYAFAKELNQENMHGYMDQYWGGWSEHIFKEDYKQLENFVVWKNGCRIGYAGIEVKKAILFLHDIQVEPIAQNRGVGSWILKKLIKISMERKCKCIRLRIFRDNPALKLYQRHEFKIVKEQKNTFTMERENWPL